MRLAGDRAVKTKKPVRFGKVDYTTLEKRRHACAEEVRLNAELAPGVYLGVTEIDGEPAVEMVRLPQDRMLDELLARGEVEPAEIDAIADVLSAFHGRAPRCAPQDARAVALANAARCPAAIRTRIEQALDRPPEGGEFAECHGDLHAANICLPGDDGRVVIYDRIEFSADIRNCDIASDVAFLAMDLDRHGRPDFADRLVARHGVDPARVPYYKIHRAALRGNVAQVRGDEEAAAAYFDLALGYTAPPSLILMCGLPGTGKSTLARRLAVPLRAAVVRSDVIRKWLAGMEATDHWDGGFLEGPYTPAMTRRTYALMLEEARALRSAGRHVIVDAVFAQETLRVAFAADAIVYMDTDEATVRERLGRRANSDAAISDAGLLEYETIRALFEPPMNAVRLSDGGVVRALLDHL